MCVYNACIYIYVYSYIHIPTMEYYSVLRKKEVLPFAMTWMDLQIIMLESKVWDHLIYIRNNKKKKKKNKTSLMSRDKSKAARGIQEYLSGY